MIYWEVPHFSSFINTTHSNISSRTGLKLYFFSLCFYRRSKVTVTIFLWHYYSTNNSLPTTLTLSVGAVTSDSDKAPDQMVAVVLVSGSTGTSSQTESNPDGRSLDYPHYLETLFTCICWPVNTLRSPGTVYLGVTGYWDCGDIQTDKDYLNNWIKPGSVGVIVKVPAEACDASNRIFSIRSHCTVYPYGSEL